MTSFVNGLGVGGPAGTARTTAADTGQAGAVRQGKVAGLNALQGAMVKTLPAPLPAMKSEMRGIVRDIAAQPPVETAKVERLAAQISGGAYRIDAGRLADAMIASEAMGISKL